MAVLFAASGVISEPAQAQYYQAQYGGFFSGWFQNPYEVYRPRHRERIPARRPVERRHIQREAAEPRSIEPKGIEGKKPVGPLYAVVSIADQHITFYDANGLWERSTISTGVAGHPTPLGIFTILEKERWHRSNIYSGAPMPYMQRLTWTGVALHEGVVTGRPASHGCVRLPGTFARRLFGATAVGQRVVVTEQDITPKDIVNAHLPVPQMVPPPRGSEDKIAGVQTGSAVEAVALDKSVAPEQNQPSDERRLNPLQFARALKTASVANAKAAVLAKKTALTLVAAKTDEVRQATKAQSEAEDALKKARLEVDAATAALTKAEGDEAVKSATERKSLAETNLTEAEDKARDAAEAKKAKDEALTAAQDAVKKAEDEAKAAAASAKDAVTRAEPLSIFISRKTKHLYVRQANEKLFDMPIEIRDPERPLGTHLFIATKPGGDGSSLQWVGLTTNAAAEIHQHRHSSRKGHKIEAIEEMTSSKPFPETASAALDRIEIPEDARQRIAERLWTGATLIISDVGMSGEGRFPMDFMILNHTTIREN